jgi:phenylpropionate dioxygenase-like ring-hydroxylating dioxygenase large terminal subunit
MLNFFSQKTKEYGEIDNKQSINEAKEENGAWLPIGDVTCLPSNLDGKTPTVLEIIGEKFVIWKNPLNNEWSVMKDFCPHRLAPLSQGRGSDSN